MMPQDHAEERHRSDFAVQSEVVHGLMAARLYRMARPRPSPAAQEEMLRTGFPRLPGSDVAKEATPQEVRRLRESMRDKAGDRREEAIANLRQQLTEYHSLLDQFSTLSAKHAALEKKFEERGGRIRSLEAEVLALRMEKARRSTRRVSCEGIQGRVAAGFLTMSQMTMQQQQQQQLHRQQQQQQQHQQQQMQDLLNPAMFQFRPGVSSFVNQFQAPNPICNTNDPSMISSSVPQSKCLQARQNIPPSPPAYPQLPGEGGFRPGPCFPTSGRIVFDRAGEPSPPPPATPERTISDDCGSAIGTTMPPHQLGTKRLMSNYFTSQQDDAQTFERDAFPSPHQPGTKRFRSNDFASRHEGAQTLERDAFPSPDNIAYVPDAA